jgi:hypothetical protein
MTRDVCADSRNRPLDWAAEAAELAKEATENHFQSHRGAIEWGPGIGAIYGNDGIRSDKTQRVLAILRQKLAAAGLQELGFGTDGDDPPYSWAMLVTRPRAPGLRLVTEPELEEALLADQLHRLIWDSWSEVVLSLMKAAGM